MKIKYKTFNASFRIPVPKENPIEIMSSEEFVEHGLVVLETKNGENIIKIQIQFVRKTFVGFLWFCTMVKDGYVYDDTTNQKVKVELVPDVNKPTGIKLNGNLLDISELQDLEEFTDEFCDLILILSRQALH